MSAYSPALYPSSFLDLLDVGKEQNCRFLWSRTIKEGSAWQAIGKRQSGKAVTRLADFKAASESYVEAIEKSVCSVDVFLSPNQFFDWRNTKQLSRLHANWIDIDTGDHAIVDAELQQQILSEVLSVIDANRLPSPTAYVASGSGGFHFYWIYGGVDAFKWRVRIWREITLRIARAIKRSRPKNASWSVDYGASRDPSRVLRLPGSIHGKSGRIVNAFIGGPRYEFDDLAEMLVKSSVNRARMMTQSVHEIVPKIVRKLPVTTQVPAVQINTNRKHSIKGWWFRIYTEICKAGRSGQVKSNVNRDYYAFLLYVALRHIKENKEDALQAVLKLNAEFIGLEDGECKAYLKSAINKNYKFKKDTVADYLENHLGIDSGFLYSIKPKSLPRAEIKLRQSSAGSATGAARRLSRLNALTAAYADLVKTRLTVTQEALAAALGCSVRTVRRYWQTLTERPIAPLLIYSPR